MTVARPENILVPTTLRAASTEVLAMSWILTKACNVLSGVHGVRGGRRSYSYLRAAHRINEVCLVIRQTEKIAMPLEYALLPTASNFLGP